MGIALFYFPFFYAEGAVYQRFDEFLHFDSTRSDVVQVGIGNETFNTHLVSPAPTSVLHLLTCTTAATAGPNHQQI
jgi:hypothetical protein